MLMNSYFVLPLNSLILIRNQWVDLTFHCHGAFYFVSHRVLLIRSNIRVLITDLQCSKMAFHIFDGFVLNDSFFVRTFTQRFNIGFLFSNLIRVTIYSQLSFNSSISVLRALLELDKHFISGTFLFFFPSGTCIEENGILVHYAG